MTVEVNEDKFPGLIDVQENQYSTLLIFEENEDGEHPALKIVGGRDGEADVQGTKVEKDTVWRVQE